MISVEVADHAVHTVILSDKVIEVFFDFRKSKRFRMLNLELGIRVKTNDRTRDRPRGLVIKGIKF